MAADEHYLKYFANFNRHGNLWRYMERARFEQLLSSSALWFSGADRFDDAFEGSISDATRQVVKYPSDVSQDQIAQFERGHLWWREWTNISCWHYAEHENALMWQAYAKTGIAIRTTFAKLSSELPERAMISPVMYKDFSREIVPEGNYIRYLVKRHFFSPEREVRAILINAPPNEQGTEDFALRNTKGGVSVRVELSRMVDAVVARPYASPAEITELRALVTRSGFTLPTLPSALSGEPRWV